MPDPQAAATPQDASVRIQAAIQLENQPQSEPPDQAQRRRALDPGQSFLVQAPAGSGKTYLLTQRFLRLLAEAEKPDEIVAITFTNAAAAEMRSRILGELEKAEAGTPDNSGPEDLTTLARQALDHSRRMGWQLLDQPGQLRITTIDAFCRNLAMQSPLSWGLLSGLGGKLDPVNNPRDLYREAARRTLQLLESGDSPERESVEAVLDWRDNHWQDVEDLIVGMLSVRNRWYQEFVFARDGDWQALRGKLEAPFSRAARARLTTLHSLLDSLPESREYALELARFACEEPGKFSPLDLAERAELPTSVAPDRPNAADPGGPGLAGPHLEDAIDAYRCLANFLLTKEGEWRKGTGLNVHHGFPLHAAGKARKAHFGEFTRSLAEEPGLQPALAAFLSPMPVGYTDEEWQLVRHCFSVLRSAAVELQMVFAETGQVDFTEVSQIALSVLAEPDGRASDFALRHADGIRHLLVDEFQDTSRNQHLLLSRIIGAWPEREHRSCFCVGDPMQSIYGFREAEVELFDRAKTRGLDTSAADPDSPPFRFEALQLRANFRTVPSLVEDLNTRFENIFALEDGSGVQFSPVQAARPSISQAKTELHLAFTDSSKDQQDASVPNSSIPRQTSKTQTSKTQTSKIQSSQAQTRQRQLADIVALIQNRLAAAKSRATDLGTDRETNRSTYRIAVLGRTKASVIRIAEALRQAGIGFRAIDLVPLRARPEVLDALALARALLNPLDRTAWLAVLRAPWCALTLAELHSLTSADDPEVSATPVPKLLDTRLKSLQNHSHFSSRAYAAADRLHRVTQSAPETRTGTLDLGTWLESIWKALGGADCVTPEQRQNLRLLWRALDKLPAGELDLVGPTLDAALEELCALPDPEASSDFGVQLMTIHKAKGLEFEVVIVPDLEAEGQKFDRALLSWLERGLPASEAENGDLTEFLIAPIQPKGDDSGDAKRWVDRVKRERITQELRRLLYVAATRAREELHIFARPKYSVNAKSGQLELCKETGLLATAWPAFGDTVQSRFTTWLETVHQDPAADWAEPAFVESMAAEAAVLADSTNLLEMPIRILQPEFSRLARPAILQRLPESYQPPEFAGLAFPRPLHGAPGSAPTASLSHDQYDQDHQDGQPSDARNALYTRTEGGLESRVLGTAIHALLESLSRLPTETWHASLQNAAPGIVASIRSRGFDPAVAKRLAAEALEAVRQTTADPVGAWILSTHPESQVEVRWTGLIQANPAKPTEAERIAAEPHKPSPTPEQLRNLRPDRVFFDAPAPGLSSNPIPTSATWWIIDYKTSSASGHNLTLEAEKQRFLAQHREQHLQQLAAYAQVLRNLQSPAPIPIRAGIYYPRLQLFDHWQA